MYGGGESQDVNLVSSTLLMKTDHAPSYNYDELNVHEISWMSCCRIQSGDGVGTGFVYGEDKEYVWVMTAGHVANAPGNSVGTKVGINFYCETKKGNADLSWTNELRPPLHWVKSHMMRGEIIWIIDYSDRHPFRDDVFKDLAIIKLAKKDFKEYPLPVIAKFADPDSKPHFNQQVLTTGCEAAWTPTTLYGYIKSTKSKTFAMLPSTAKGRSGSAVFDVKTKKIIGIILRRDGIVNIKKIYEVTQWKKKKASSQGTQKKSK